MLPTFSAIGYCLFISYLQAQAPSYVLKWVSKQFRRKAYWQGTGCPSPEGKKY